MKRQPLAFASASAGSMAAHLAQAWMNEVWIDRYGGL